MNCSLYQLQKLKPSDYLSAKTATAAVSVPTLKQEAKQSDTCVQQLNVPCLSRDVEATLHQPYCGRRTEEKFSVSTEGTSEVWSVGAFQVHRE